MLGLCLDYNCLEICQVLSYDLGCRAGIDVLHQPELQYYLFGQLHLHRETGAALPRGKSGLLCLITPGYLVHREVGLLA
jgi:hypothetical protein